MKLCIRLFLFVREESSVKKADKLNPLCYTIIYAEIHEEESGFSTGRGF